MNSHTPMSDASSTRESRASHCSRLPMWKSLIDRMCIYNENYSQFCCHSIAFASSGNGCDSTNVNDELLQLLLLRLATYRGAPNKFQLVSRFELAARCIAIIRLLRRGFCGKMVEWKTNKWIFGWNRFNVNSAPKMFEHISDIGKWEIEIVSFVVLSSTVRQCAASANSRRLPMQRTYTEAERHSSTKSNETAQKQ